jgi:hypothetical protein
MQQPTASLEAINPLRGQFIWAALIGVLCANVAMTGLGCLIGYVFTLGAPHVVQPYAMFDVAAAGGVTALVALSLAVWRGAARR